MILKSIVLDAFETWGGNTSYQRYFVDQLRCGKEDVTRYADIKLAIDSFLRSFAMKCIVGEHDIEADWDYMIAELKNLGLDEYIQITQKAYDRMYKN